MVLTNEIWFWYSLIFIVGLMLGSYLNSWVWRVHEGRWQFKSQSTPAGDAEPVVIRVGTRSICIHCQRVLAWFENIPLGSFLVLRGQCRTCRKSIPVDYFLVELVTALLFVGVTYYQLHLSVFSQWHFFRDLFFVALLIVVFVYDAKYYIIPPVVVWAGAIIGLALNLKLLLTPYSLFLGMVVGGGFFLAQYLISKGKWIGGGDVRLGVMMGSWLGWPGILVALFISYVLGALVAIPLLVLKKKGMKSEIPFGTFLAVGTAAAMFWGNNIMQWYLGLIKL